MGHVEGNTSSMKRELSVEDLFAPLNRLDVRPQSSSVASSLPTSSDISSSSPSRSVGLSPGCLPLSETTPTNQGDGVALPVSFRSQRMSRQLNTHVTPQSQASDRRLMQASCGQVQDLENHASASLPRRFDPSKMSTVPFPLVGSAISGIQSAGVDREVVNESGNSVTYSTAVQSDSDFAKLSMNTSVSEEARSGQNEKGVVNKSREVERSRSSTLKGSGGSKSPASGSDTGLQTQGNSTSDEDQQVLDDRKQRRMLSNRESARRSRLRKQQHLDELRAHVALLRAENSQMRSRFNLTSQHYAQLTEENSVLRSEVVDLSHKLQSLHHTVASQYHNGFRRGPDSGQMAQGILREE